METRSDIGNLPRERYGAKLRWVYRQKCCSVSGPQPEPWSSQNAALRFPGVVVLHDLVLQHLFLGLSVERGDAALYVSEMKRAYGTRGAVLGRQIAAARGSELLTSKFPLCERMVERS